MLVPDAAEHEAHALGLGAREHENAVADHAVAQQGRRAVEEDEIEPITAHFSAELAGEPPQRILHGGRLAHRVLVEEQRDIDIAVGAGSAAPSASKQVSETHLGIGAEATGKTVA